ncbi:MAG: peptide deformylase [Candidatus Saccharimonadia bacterium]
MTRNDIITLPNPLLRTKSKRITFIDEDIHRLAQNMIDATLDWEASRDHESGAALAAVQVAKAVRLVVVRHDFENKEDKSFDVLINPEIVKSEGQPTEWLEGCLSVGDIYGHVMRYPKVKVKALNLDGKAIRITATDFLAEVLQHEIDHTNGIVFVDRISDPTKLFHLEEDGKLVPIKPS